MKVCDFCKETEKHRTAHTYNIELTNLDVDEEDGAANVSGIDYCYDLCSICAGMLAEVINKAIPEGA